jgi:hypothetical protein
MRMQFLMSEVPLYRGGIPRVRAKRITLKGFEDVDLRPRPESGLDLAVVYAPYSPDNGLARS